MKEEGKWKCKECFVDCSCHKAQRKIDAVVERLSIINEPEGYIYWSSDSEHYRMKTKDFLKEILEKLKL